MSLCPSNVSIKKKVINLIEVAVFSIISYMLINAYKWKWSILWFRRNETTNEILSRHIPFLESFMLCCFYEKDCSVLNISIQKCPQEDTRGFERIVEQPEFRNSWAKDRSHQGVKETSWHIRLISWLSFIIM